MNIYYVTVKFYGTVYVPPAPVEPEVEEEPEDLEPAFKPE